MTLAVILLILVSNAVTAGLVMYRERDIHWHDDISSDWTLSETSRNHISVTRFVTCQRCHRVEEEVVGTHRCPDRLKCTHLDHLLNADARIRTLEDNLGL